MFIFKSAYFTIRPLSAVLVHKLSGNRSMRNKYHHPHKHALRTAPFYFQNSGLALSLIPVHIWYSSFPIPYIPTGYLYTRREMEQLRDIVKRYDLFLYSDEVYREFCYTGAPYISAFHLAGIEGQVVLIDSVSKRYSECGIRVGAIITKHKELKKNLIKFCQARLSPPLLGQIVAEASIDAPEDYMLMTYNEYVERRKFLIDGINRLPGCYSPIPMGAFYTVVSLPVDDADRFCQWCLSDFDYEGETVFMAPASGFYTTPGLGRNEVRMAYVLSKDDLARALVVLEKALQTYPGRTI